MVLFTISKQITNLIGPALFRTGLSTRNLLALAVSPNSSDTPYLDLLCGIPYSQKLLSLSVYDESARVVSKFKEASRVEKALDATYDALFGSNTSPEEQAQVEQSIADIRLEVLEEQLRPALLPNEQWGDVLQWKWNPRIMKWLRQELLVAKYGPRVKEALDAYPQLRASPQFSPHPTRRLLVNLARGRLDLEISSSMMMKDESSIHPKKKQRTMLPSSDTLLKAFGMRDWATTKDTAGTRLVVGSIASQLGGSVLRLGNGTMSNHAKIDLEADVSKISLEDVLEVSGGHVKHCGPFNAVCEEAGIYQLWTKEYIQLLGDYLLERTREFYTSSHGGETVIVDIGAGDGLLIHFLHEHMHSCQSTRNEKRKVTPLPKLVATDDGSENIFAKAQVEKLDASSALLKYGQNKFTEEADNIQRKQVIILCSWMPIGQDWTSKFRDAEVDEYILIGEADDGSCGDNWQTWGNAEFRVESDTNPSNPRYVDDGYRRWDMAVLSKFQFSRYDCKVSRCSSTVSFRQMKKQSEHV